MKREPHKVTQAPRLAWTSSVYMARSSWSHVAAWTSTTSKPTEREESPANCLSFTGDLIYMTLRHLLVTAPQPSAGDADSNEVSRWVLRKQEHQQTANTETGKMHQCDLRMDWSLSNPSNHKQENIPPISSLFEEGKLSILLLHTFIYPNGCSRRTVLTLHKGILVLQRN